MRCGMSCGAMVCRIWGTAPACGSLMRPFLKNGEHAAGGRPPVQRHGGHGRAAPDRRVAARCQLTGPALVDRELFCLNVDRRGGTLPAGGDSERATVGATAAVGAADAGRAFAAGVPATWVTATAWTGSSPMAASGCVSTAGRCPGGLGQGRWVWRAAAPGEHAPGQLAGGGWTRLRAGDGRKARGGMTGAGDPRRSGGPRLAPLVAPSGGSVSPPR